jgi:DNA repair exonuclease SbcCD ATPase subunit
MIIENLMFAALGFLCASILALLIMPSVWRRAVRLTKRRIAAATPVTLTEFKAEKDQLRAKYALDMRKLELQLDDLRHKRATHLNELTEMRETLELQTREYNEAISIADDMEERNENLRDRVRAYEIETTNLSQRLRARERDLADKLQELDEARAVANIANSATISAFNEAKMTGDYDRDTGNLLNAVQVQKQRADNLEKRFKASIEQIKQIKAKYKLSAEDLLENGIPDLIDEAEAQIRITAARFKRLSQEGLKESKTTASPAEEPAEETHSLAHELSLEDELDDIGSRIKDIEEDILANFAQKNADHDAMRRRLEDLAVDISHIVYANDAQDEAVEQEESLFDRVRKYAEDGLEELETPEAEHKSGRGRVSDRMDALKRVAGNQ